MHITKFRCSFKLKYYVAAGESNVVTGHSWQAHASDYKSHRIISYHANIQFIIEYDILIINAHPTRGIITS
jgi:hypothetical protein